MSRPEHSWLHNCIAIGFLMPNEIGATLEQPCSIRTYSVSFWTIKMTDIVLSTLNLTHSFNSIYFCHCKVSAHCARLFPTGVMARSWTCAAYGLQTCQWSAVWVCEGWLEMECWPCWQGWESCHGNIAQCNSGYQVPVHTKHGGGGLQQAIQLHWVYLARFSISAITLNYM